MDLTTEDPEEANLTTHIIHSHLYTFHLIVVLNWSNYFQNNNWKRQGRDEEN